VWWQVLVLQSAVENLKVWSDSLNRTVTLQDICLQPLFPDNKKCAIMSILNYFQNNATNLDVVRLDEFGLRVADYVTHISECAR